MKNNISRAMIVGTGSGCGKTTVTCALLKALKKRKLNIASFKCGPDYIDPMFHSEIIGTKSRNLDLFLCGENTVKYLLAEDSQGMDVAIIEGVMGIYDGMGFSDDRFSANHISRETNTPEILVVNVRGKSISLLAEISGYLNFAENQIAGVILNNCSTAMYPTYQTMIEEKMQIKVFGYMPQVKEAEIGSRHLGLVTAEEIDDLKSKVEALGRAAEESLDLDGILRLAETAQEFTYEEITLGPVSKDVVTIGVARDKAFCFYYEDNFKLLEKLGAKFVFFSPLIDANLPEGIHGLIFGGGYPEEYLAELTANASLFGQIKIAIDSGLPVYAECGGFMYLGESIAKKGEKHKMVGAIKGDSHMTDRLVRFGYKTLTANTDNLMCSAGEEIKCHEFHYSDTNNHGDAFTASKNGGRSWQTIIGTDTIFAGYPHLHLWSNIIFAKNFVNKCREHRGGNLWK